MGLGYTMAICILAFIRELFGAGSLTLFMFGDISIKLNLIPNNLFEPITILVLAPGAFITLGILLAIINAIKLKKENNKKATINS